VIATARPLRGASDWSLGGVAAWWRAHPWLPIAFVVMLWAIMPGVRRLIDWRIGFNYIAIASIVPLLALIPFAVLVLYRDLGKFRRSIAVCAWLWAGGFGYAFFVGLVTGNGLAAVYSVLNFILPMFFGLWVATLDVAPEALSERVAAIALWIATPLALYAVFQYVALPAWDAEWMRNTQIISIGTPAPFQFRPFSTLNAPGPFADFLVAVLLLNLPRLKRLSGLQLAQIMLLVGVLVLTMVRTAWIATALGVFVYLLMSPNRAKNLAIFSLVGAVCTLLVLNAGVLLGNDQAGSDLSRRFETLSNLQTDSSYNVRQGYFGDQLQTALSQPTGGGLGLLGTAAKLGANQQVVDFDNGYVARLTEMGYFGTACYLATLIAGLVLAWRYWNDARRRGSPREAAFGAAVFALQLTLAFADISSDHHNQFSGIFFWLSLALVCGRHEPIRRAMQAVRP
jgi:putative inorganic carbon (hco3(-)) transporter